MRLRTFGGLWIERPDASPAAGPRPRGLALLAILAVAGARGASRDRILGVLWPETDEERARHALSQTLYGLRRDLGADVVVSAPALRLDPERLTSDVGDFRAAIAARRWTDAAALYTGPFLDGVYLADAPEFERWAEAERAALATEGIRAIETVARASADAGRREEAAEHWHRLARLDPLDPRIAASCMEALAALGDRAAALAHGRAHVELRRRELDAAPDAAVERLMARLREAPHQPPGALASDVAPSARRSRPVRVSGALAAASTVASTVASSAASTVARVSSAMRARRDVVPRGRRGMLAAAGLVALGVAAAVGWRWMTEARRPAHPVLAVGRIRDLAAPGSAALGAMSSEMLATSLGRLDGLQVIANSRMLELTPRGSDTSRSAFTDAARRAGATEMLEGELVPAADRRFRLEVRRVDLARGIVRRGYRVAGTDRIALIDSVTALVAADLRVGAPPGSLTEVSTRSPVAYRFYEEGLRALYQYDAYAASRLFRSALREDSTFALATYYAWRTARATGEPDEARLAARAVALASRAPPRDRLLILTHVGAENADLRALAAADTLATQYPRDPEALVRAAEVVVDLGRTVALLDRAIAIDSAAAPGTTALCRLCEALSQLVRRYEWADSTEAVRRTLARWRVLRPADATPWALEADLLVGLGRRAEADAALRRYEALGGTQAGVHLAGLVRSLRLDDVDAANRACDEGLASADSAGFVRYRWYCVIALRMQGRHRDALALARDGRAPRSGVVRHRLAPDAYQAAILDMETGRPLAAADAYLAMARGRAPRADAGTVRAGEGIRARYHAWLLTLSATAAVAGGDTMRARALVDSIERVGHRSLYARDPLLHHFVRGLLDARAGRDEAAVRELRAAMHSPTYGYTRINLELGEALLALGRPREAIPVVQAALRGGIEGSGLYVTRTELHELLARAYAASGQSDSAAAHYAVVARAWRAADPMLAPRAVAARRWLTGRAAAR